MKDGLLVVAPTDHVHQLANVLFLNSNRRAVAMSSPLDSLLAMQFWFSWKGSLVLGERFQRLVDQVAR